MADGINIKLEGFEGVTAALRKLEIKMAKKIVRTAVRNGAKVARAEIKSSAPVQAGPEGGTLRKSITIRARKRRKKNEFAMNVLFDTRRYPKLVNFSIGSKSDIGTRKFSGQRYFYPAALEYGTKTNPNIKTKGWMRKAWDRKKRASLAVVEQNILQGIEREASKK